jgi:hypothetical protein
VLTGDPLKSKARYSASVRSRPPVITSIFRSTFLLKRVAVPR